jgi:uncharacterized peroxidase-related enzyme
MPYIEVIEEHDADDALKQAYDKVAGDRGRAANILRIHSLLPETMTGHLDFYMKIMFAKGALNRQERELVATVVSAANDCEYCVNHHAEALFAYVKDRDIVNQIGKDYTQVELSEKERAMCDHAVKLTQYPDHVGESDVETLRQAGLSDKDVLHLTMVIGYFNFVNRMALGLGVPFSEEEIKGYKY